MNDFHQSTIDLLISGIMGILGGLITVPLNAILSWSLKKDELEYKYKLDAIAKKRELLLQHKLELERLDRKQETDELKSELSKYKGRNGE